MAVPFAETEGTVLLISGGDYSSSEHSYLAIFPRQIITVFSKDNPWKVLSETLDDRLWFGFLEYGMGRGSVPGLSIPERDSGAEPAWFANHGCVLSVNHHQGIAEIVTDGLSQEEERIIAPWLKGQFPVGKPEEPFHSLVLAKPVIDSQLYTSQINKVLEWIREGEVYQANISHRIEWNGSCNPYSLFYHLFIENPSPFSAYLRTKLRTIVSLSPERFIKLHEGIIETRPIKGTAPRGSTLKEDQKSMDYLLHSEKEQAELLMITDLMRNDLAKVCLPGTVEVPQLRVAEAFANVFHMHSKIMGKIIPSLAPIDIIRSCFPAGSITGCPKRRAMELIDEIEQRPRGIYTGAIGWIKGREACDFNVAIRTLDVRQQSVSVQLGGGITIDSVPENEFHETMHKGRTFFKIIK